MVLLRWIWKGASLLLLLLMIFFFFYCSDSSPFCRSRECPAEGSRHEPTIFSSHHQSHSSNGRLTPSTFSISFLQKMLMKPTDRMSSDSLSAVIFLPFDLWRHHSDREIFLCRYRPTQKEIVTQSICSLSRISWKSWNRSEMSWLQNPWG